jgi:membrane-associated phospholipid phosphatase
MALIQTRLKEAWAVITSPQFIKQMLWVAVFWALTVFFIIVNIQFLKSQYPNPARPDDLLLDLIPETTAFIAIGDIMTSGMFMLTIFYFSIWQGNTRKFPYLLFLLAVMYLMRAFVINMTPLAQIQPPSENFSEDHFIAQTFYHGMYFSGHTASAFMQAFFFKGANNRWILFILASVAAFSLIASHSHYTIDVIGGFFAAYFIVKFDWMRLVPSFLREVQWMPWYQKAD